LRGCPVELLADPDIYALVMEGASWSEITDFIRALAFEQLEREGHTVFRMEESRFIQLPPSTNFTEGFPRFIPADDFAEFPRFILADGFVHFDIDIEELFARFNKYGLPVVELDLADINILPRITIDPGDFDGRLRIMPRD